jgi:hypothetical protein
VKIGDVWPNDPVGAIALAANDGCVVGLNGRGSVFRGEFIAIPNVLPFAVLFGLHEHNLSSTRYHESPASMSCSTS